MKRKKLEIFVKKADWNGCEVIDLWWIWQGVGYDVDSGSAAISKDSLSRWMVHLFKKYKR